MAWGSKDNQAIAQSSGTAPAKRGGAMLSFIGAEVTITGNISGNGDIHLDGSVDGDVTCNTLILGQSGRVRGNIIAEKATLGGSVDGTVNATTLTVEKSARISGDLAYDMVSIETGAQVDGRVSHRSPAAQGGLKLITTAAE